MTVSPPLETVSDNPDRSETNMFSNTGNADAITIAAIAKDEAPYIGEWIAFHLSIGANRIIIYNNDSGDDTGKIVEEISFIDNRVRLIDWPSMNGQSPQRSAYQNALSIVETPWVAFIDIDEFIVLHDDNSLQQFIARIPRDVSSVHVNWLGFGSSGRSLPDYEFVIEAFTKSAPVPWGNNHHFKTIARTKNATVALVHNIETSEGKKVLSDFNEFEMINHGISDRIVHAGIQINHYQSKTYPEFERRMKRGDANYPKGHPDRTRDATVKRFNQLDQNSENNFRLQKFLPQFHIQYRQIESTLKRFDTSKLIASPIGYAWNDGGINNQKIALLGLFVAAAAQETRSARRLYLPEIHNKDQDERLSTQLPFDAIFSEEKIQAFANRWDIEIVSVPHDVIYNDRVARCGWNYFDRGAQHMSHFQKNALLIASDISADFFRSLQPKVLEEPAYISLVEKLFSEKSVRIVCQFRIEEDWFNHCFHTLRPTIQEPEDLYLTGTEIAQKVVNTLDVGLSPVYVSCDEKYLRASRAAIIDDVSAKTGIRTIWKSDLLTENFEPVQAALIDFEISKRAEIFVGTTRSTFANLVVFERYVSDFNRSGRLDYAYNLLGSSLGLRTDYGSTDRPQEACKPRKKPETTSVLRTIHNTIVYFDPAQGVCRHGDYEEAVGHLVEVVLNDDACLLRVKSENGYNGIGFKQGKLILADEPSKIDIVIAGRGVKVLRHDTKYIAAEPGGTLICDREAASAWEHFYLPLSQNR